MVITIKRTENPLRLMPKPITMDAWLRSVTSMKVHENTFFNGAYIPPETAGERIKGGICTPALYHLVSEKSGSVEGYEFHEMFLYTTALDNTPCFVALGIYSVPGKGTNIQIKVSSRNDDLADMLLEHVSADVRAQLIFSKEPESTAPHEQSHDEIPGQTPITQGIIKGYGKGENVTTGSGVMDDGGYSGVSGEATTERGGDEGEHWVPNEVGVDDPTRLRLMMLQKKWLNELRAGNKEHDVTFDPEAFKDKKSVKKDDDSKRIKKKVKKKVRKKGAGEDEGVGTGRTGEQ